MTSEEGRRQIHRGSGRVLVVNDDASSRQFLRLNLETLGYRVGLAEDGIQALACLAQSSYDAMLLDLRMPNMDGFEVLEKLKADPLLRHLPVIVVSASDDQQDVIRCIELGATDFLSTPLDPVLLKARVGSSLASQQLRKTEVEYVRYLHQLTRAVGALNSDQFDPHSLDEMGRRTDALGELARLFQDLGQEVFTRRRHQSAEMRDLRGELLELQDAIRDSSLTGRVLVVDDDSTSRKVLARSLMRSGYDVDQAADGVDALEQLRARAYDTVLLDLEMPLKDGFQVLQEMKQDSQLHDIPVIVISANEDTEEVVRLIEMGANDHLTKPCNQHLLWARLRACLVSKRMRDQELVYLRGVTTLTQAAAAIEDDCFDPDSLTEVSARNDAVGRLARVFQEMARDIVARQRSLNRQVQELKGELEEARQRSELTDSAQTDYSQTLDTQSLVAGSARVVVFCSFRGGTGKTQTVANLGVLLASAGCRVGLVDLAIQSPGLHSAFGISAHELGSTLTDFLFDKAPIGEVTVDLMARLGIAGGGRLLLVPAANKIHTMARLLRQGYDPQLLTRGLQSLVSEAGLELLLIDTQAGLNEEVMLALLLAQSAFVMLRPERQGFEGAGLLVQVAQRLKVPGYEVLLNQIGPHQLALRQQLRETYGTDVRTLPLAEGLDSLGNGEVFCLRFPEDPLTSVLREMAARMMA